MSMIKSRNLNLLTLFFFPITLWCLICYHFNTKVIGTITWQLDHALKLVQSLKYTLTIKHIQGKALMLSSLVSETISITLGLVVMLRQGKTYTCLLNFYQRNALWWEENCLSLYHLLRFHLIQRIWKIMQRNNYQEHFLFSTLVSAKEHGKQLAGKFP